MPKPQHVHYLRNDLPDGFSDVLRALANDLIAGAVDLREGSQSRETSDRYHAAIDARRLMERTAERMRGLVGPARLPG